jgi:15-cis-phytoene synthase
MDLDTAYALSARITKREARNFYYAFLSLPIRQRHAVYALYAFCREADDVADAASPVRDDAANSSVMPDLAVDKRAQLALFHERLMAAANGTPTVPRDVALADALQRFGIDAADLAAVLHGLDMDLTLSRVQSEADLDRYCYHVASAVGLATLPVLTGGTLPSSDMRSAAVELGLGMQYVNVLRDVSEDLERGRIYLPRDMLDRFGVGEAMLQDRAMNASLRAAFAHHSRRARSLLASGRRLIPLLPRRSRSCPWLLSELYGRILSRIEGRDYDVFSDRVSLPKREKVWLLASTLWRRL